jgi:hypothetical protein
LKQNAGQLNICITNRILQFIQYAVNSHIRIALVGTKFSNGNASNSDTAEYGGDLIARTIWIEKDSISGFLSWNRRTLRF